LVKKTYSKFVKLKAKSTFELNVWTKCAYRCNKFKSSLISTHSFVLLIITWISFLIIGMNDLHLISKKDIWNKKVHVHIFKMNMFDSFSTLDMLRIFLKFTWLQLCK
jgi:hypothetical protein